MASTPGWEVEGLDAQAWNFCRIGGKLLPGIVEVTCDKSRKVDKQSPKGTDGNFLKDEGYDGGKVTIKVTIINDEQWQAYQELLPSIDPEQVGGLKRPHEILHPEPNSKGIKTVFVTKISGSPPTAKSGKVETIECEQWFPAPKPKKSSDKPGGQGADAHPIIIPPDLVINTFG
jgi:hypothetical protein